MLYPLSYSRAAGECSKWDRAHRVPEIGKDGAFHPESTEYQYIESPHCGAETSPRSAFRDPRMPLHPAPSILIVDDSKVSRNMALGLIRLRRPDVVLLEAADGLQAIASAAEHQPDLILMDVNMPGMTGIEASIAILEQHPHATIALLTANVQAATQAKAEAIGVRMFKKPVKGDVIDAILQLLTVAA